MVNPMIDKDSRLPYEFNVLETLLGARQVVPKKGILCFLPEDCVLSCYYDKEWRVCEYYTGRMFGTGKTLSDGLYEAYAFILRMLSIEQGQQKLFYKNYKDFFDKNRKVYPNINKGGTNEHAIHRK